MNKHPVINKIYNLPFLAEILSILGGIIYSIQALEYAHIETSMVDEGGYLYIGYLNSKNLLHLFEDFTYPGWYAPLSYLIPGQIQKWFGPGLRTGRLFSVFMGLLMLVAVWLIARRFGNRWWGAAIVWTYALSPVGIQIYSLATMEATVACLLAWSLYLVLGEHRRHWQIFLGSILVGLAIMTRHTILPLIFLLVIYVFWQHGKKLGLIALAGGFLPLLIFHIIYWPNILQLWASWLPSGLTPFLDSYRFPVASFNYEYDYSTAALLYAFALGFRYQFYPLVGCIAVILLWPKSQGQKMSFRKKAAIFLLVSFVLLNLLHIWAAFSTSEYAKGCIFCYETYISYYSVLAIILVVVSAEFWKGQETTLGRVLLYVTIIFLFTVICFANTEGYGDQLVFYKVPAIDRGINPLSWFPMVTIKSVIDNKFLLTFTESRKYVSVLAGLVLGILTVILLNLLILLLKTEKLKISLNKLVFSVILSIGLIFSPLMGGEFRDDGLCEDSTLFSNEKVGGELARIIPEGSNVYWDVSNPIPLLYLPPVNIHLAQVYGIYSYRLGGNSQLIEKHGFWNEILAAQWASEAEILIFEANSTTTYPLENELDLSKFEKFLTSPINSCKPETNLMVLKRVEN